VPNHQPNTRSKLADSSEVLIYKRVVHPLATSSVHACLCVCMHPVITTGFGKSGSVLTAPPVLCKTELSEENTLFKSQIVTMLSITEKMLR